VFGARPGAWSRSRQAFDFLSMYRTVRCAAAQAGVVNQIWGAPTTPAFFIASCSNGDAANACACSAVPKSCHPRDRPDAIRRLGSPGTPARGPSRRQGIHHPRGSHHPPRRPRGPSPRHPGALRAAPQRTGARLSRRRARGRARTRPPAPAWPYQQLVAGQGITSSADWRRSRPAPAETSRPSEFCSATDDDQGRRGLTTHFSFHEHPGASTRPDAACEAIAFMGRRATSSRSRSAAPSEYRPGGWRRRAGCAVLPARLFAVAWTSRWPSQLAWLCLVSSSCSYGFRRAAGVLRTAEPRLGAPWLPPGGQADGDVVTVRGGVAIADTPGQILAAAAYSAAATSPPKTGSGSVL
jgi:hypothetical protein